MRTFSKTTYDDLEEKIAAFISGTSNIDFATLLLKVFAFQKSTNPAYAQFCKAFPEPTQWQEIPAIPQSIFKQTAIRSFPEAQTIRTFRTSGTTGEGYGQHHFASLRLYELTVHYGWIDAGLPLPVDYCLMPSSAEQPHSSLSQMAEWLIQDRKGFLMHNGLLDRKKLCDLKGQKCTLFGTALAFLHAIETIPQNSLQLAEGSILIETGGYKGSGRQISKDDLYASIQSVFGPVSIYNEYGMTELTSQFYAHQGGIHKNPPWAKVVVVNPTTNQPVKPGESGMVKIFDLANLGSICAILTQDLAVCFEEGFQLLGRDPSALPRGCSRSADEWLQYPVPPQS